MQIEDIFAKADRICKELGAKDYDDCLMIIEKKEIGSRSLQKLNP